MKAAIIDFAKIKLKKLIEQGVKDGTIIRFPKKGTKKDV